MNILDRIVSKKKEIIAESKQRISQSELRSLPYYHASTCSLRKNLIETPRPVGIIAEMKKASPSKGVLMEDYQPTVLFKKYKEAKVEGISILTDQEFFQGSINHLLQIRELTETIPLLRKDFIIDPYQVDEAKGYGASVILLIAAILEPIQYQELYLQAKELGLEVLTEVHDQDDIQKVLKAFTPEMIGINNRDLTTFNTSIQHTHQLLRQLPKETLLISESGIHSHEQVETLSNLGIKGVLVGERIVKAANQVEAIYELVEKR